MTENMTTRQAAMNAADARTLQLSSAKGVAVGAAIADAFVASVQHAIGEKFDVTVNSLMPRPGSRVTRDDMVHVIGQVLGVNEGLSAMSSSSAWHVGDAVIAAEALFGDADEFIPQICRLSGKTKHTIMQSARTCRAFPVHDRIPGLHHTHHYKMLPYLSRVDPVKLRELAERAANGDPEETRHIEIFDEDTGDRKIETQRCEWSAARLAVELRDEFGVNQRPRVRLDDAIAAANSAAGTDPGTESIQEIENGFLYFDAYGRVFQSAEFSREDAENSVAVISLESFSTVDVYGNENDFIPVIVPGLICPKKPEEPERSEEPEDDAPDPEETTVAYDDDQQQPE